MLTSQTPSKNEIVRYRSKREPSVPLGDVLPAVAADLKISVELAEDTSSPMLLKIVPKRAESGGLKLRSRRWKRPLTPSAANILTELTCR